MGLHAPIVEAGETFSWDLDTPETVARGYWMRDPPARTLVALDPDTDTIVGTAEMGPNRGGGGAHVASAGFMVAGLRDPGHGAGGLPRSAAWPGRPSHHVPGAVVVRCPRRRRADPASSPAPPSNATAPAAPIPASPDWKSVPGTTGAVAAGATGATAGAGDGKRVEVDAACAPVGSPTAATAAVTTIARRARVDERACRYMPFPWSGWCVFRHETTLRRAARSLLGDEASPGAVRDAIVAVLSDGSGERAAAQRTAREIAAMPAPDVVAAELLALVA